MESVIVRFHGVVELLRVPRSDVQALRLVHHVVLCECDSGQQGEQNDL